MGAAAAVKRMLYRTLSLDMYLRVVSRMFFLCYETGLGRMSEAFEYPYFLKNLVSEDDTVIDIGANLGYYSYVFVRIARHGHVYAVEPVPQICSVLRRNLRGAENVTIYNCALGAEDKKIVMGNDSAAQSGYLGTGRNFVIDGVNTSRTHAGVEFDASMRRGSELFGSLEKLDFIKCDIEGYEVAAIPEMASVIERHRPTVLIETGGDKRAVMVDFFTRRGYAGYTLCRGRLVPLRGDDDKDIVFIHDSRRERFSHLLPL